MSSISTLILAAGLGTRMKSAVPKVLHELCGHPLLFYPISVSKRLKAKLIAVVANPKHKEVHDFIKENGVVRVIQSKPLGTAHAVMAAKRALSRKPGYVFILSGDVPLITETTLQALLAEVQRENAVLGLVSMQPDDPLEYGRIIRDLDGRVVRIVEARDANESERSIREVNAGVYCVKTPWLFQALKKIQPTNIKQEYYVTDLVSIAGRDHLPVVALRAKDPEEFIGINTRADLARGARKMRHRIHQRHMLAGVSIIDPEQTYIDESVKIGPETTIFPGSFLSGKTVVGSGCIIHHGATLCDAMIEEGVTVKAMSVVEGSRLERGSVVGPFARIRPESRIGPKVKIGNFVEVKKSYFKQGSKASHLAYLGDALIGAYANVGCGTITANYDGKNKHRTIIGERASIGSDTQLVAPVKVGKGATTGAGATITRNVPAGALAISKKTQLIVKHWKPKWKRSKTRGKKARA